MRKLLQLAVFLILLGCEGFERIENHFKNYDEATQSGIVGEDNWVPAFLPRSSKNILEAHNLDTNEVWLAFDIEANDYKLLSSNCKSVSLENVIFPIHVRSVALSWWPQHLTRHNLDKFSIFQKTAFFKCRRKNSYMSIDKERNRTYYWLTYPGEKLED